MPSREPCASSSFSSPRSGDRPNGARPETNCAVRSRGAAVERDGPGLGGQAEPPCPAGHRGRAGRGPGAGLEAGAAAARGGRLQRAARAALALGVGDAGLAAPQRADRGTAAAQAHRAAGIDRGQLGRADREASVGPAGVVAGAGRAGAEPGGGELVVGGAGHPIEAAADQGGGGQAVERQGASVHRAGVAVAAGVHADAAAAHPARVVLHAEDAAALAVGGAGRARGQRAGRRAAGAGELRRGGRGDHPHPAGQAGVEAGAVTLRLAARPAPAHVALGGVGRGHQEVGVAHARVTAVGVGRAGREAVVRLRGRREDEGVVHAVPAAAAAISGEHAAVGQGHVAAGGEGPAVTDVELADRAHLVGDRTDRRRAGR